MQTTRHAKVWDGLGRAVARFARDALELLLPEEDGCALCGRTGRSRMTEVFFTPICRGCLAAIPFVHPPYCDMCGRPLRGVASTQCAAPCMETPASAARAARGSPRTSGVPGATGVTGATGAPGSPRAPAANWRCSDCSAGGRFFRIARAAGVYEGIVRELIYALKFNGRRDLAEGLGVLMARVARRERAMRSADILVPVPLHPRRLAERGYNQAELLGQVAGPCLGIPVKSALARAVSTDEQNKLGRGGRRENLRGAFVVPHPITVAGRRALLVDDVITTGATADECARALLRAGATEVCVLTAAVAPFEREWLSPAPSSPQAR